MKNLLSPKSKATRALTSIKWHRSVHTVDLITRSSRSHLALSQRVSSYVLSTPWLCIEAPYVPWAASVSRDWSYTRILRFIKCRKLMSLPSKSIEQILPSNNASRWRKTSCRTMPPARLKNGRGRNAIRARAYFPANATVDESSPRQDITSHQHVRTDRQYITASFEFALASTDKLPASLKPPLAP